MDRKKDAKGNLSAATRGVTTGNAPLPVSGETRKDAPDVSAASPMNTLARKLAEFSRRITPLAEAVGVPFSWHFVNSDQLQNIPPEQRQSKPRFCMRTRDSARFTLDRCLRDHREIAFRRALLEREPFMMICHAGAALLAVPLFAGERFLGVFFAGPVIGNPVPAYPEMQADYRELPGRTSRELLALGRYLKGEFDAHFAELRPPAARGVLTPQLTTPDTRVLKAAHLMRMRRRRRISAAEIAAACGVSVSTLLHLFRRETGFAFRDWLLRLRVSDALGLVEGSDLPFNEIALTCGFSDQSRMTVLMKRYLGRTPRELRRSAAFHTGGEPAAVSSR